MKARVKVLIAALLTGGCSDGGFMWPDDNEAGTNISNYQAPLREDGTMLVGGRTFTSDDAIDPIATYIEIGENVSKTVQSPMVKKDECYRGGLSLETRDGNLRSTVRICLEGESGVRVHETTTVSPKGEGEPRTSYGELVARYRHEGYTLALYDIAAQGDLAKGGIPGNRIVINGFDETNYPMYVLHHRFLHPVRMVRDSFSEWRGTVDPLPSRG